MKITKMTGTNGEALTFVTPTKADLAGLGWFPRGGDYPVPFARVPSGRALVVQMATAPKGHPIKGGEGSGHFGHAGIPDHQGGSLPSKGPKKGRGKKAKKAGLPALREMGAWDAPDGPPTATEEEVLTLIAGGEDWYDGEEPDADTGLPTFGTPFSRDEDLKTAVVTTLAEEIGVTESMANVFIQDWSVSSNDTILSSLTHQRLAAETFGIELTAWQKESLATAEALRRDIIEKYVAEQFEGDKPVLTKVALRMLAARLDENANDMHDPFYPFEAGILKEMVADARKKSERVSRAEFMALVGTIEARSEDLTRAAVQSIYNRTQQQLAEAGIESMTLFRGAQFENVRIGAPGSALRATTNALSSWSASEYTADAAFAYRAPDEEYTASRSTGVVFGARVPAARIYSLPTTGPGNLNEWEAIVIGSATPEPITIKTTYKDRRKTMKALIKGGPGSGHFDHDGIPDHQGGSLPSYGRTKPAKEAKPKTVKPAKRRGFIKPTGKLRAEADKGEKVAADVDLFDVQAGEPGKWAEALAYPDYGAKRYQADLKYADRLKEAAGLALMDDVPGITAPMANDFLSDWAVSSNDEHLPSLTHQKLAAQIFGTKLTAWQKEHLVEAERHRASVLGGFMQDMFWDDSSLNANVILDHWDRALSDDASESTHTASLPFERDILHRRAYGPDLPPLHNKEEVLALLADVRKESETLTKAAIKSVYNRTQAKLAEAGVTHLRLFRGAVSLGIDPGEAGQTVTPTTNALSSWTTSEYVADNGFANTKSYDYKTRKMMGAVYTAVVPADRVYSLPATGPGTLFEWEAIVIGDATGDPLRIKTTYKADRQSR